MESARLRVKSPSAYATDLWRRIPRHLKITFFAAVILGLLIHMYMMTNKLPNHDDIGQIFDPMNRPRSGRWFLVVPASLSSSYSLPWIGGLFSMINIGLSACLVVTCLNIRRALNCVLAAGIMVAFPTVACTLTFMNSADSYFFSLLLACLAVYLTKRWRFGFLAAIPLLTLSLGIYQAYFCTAAALYICMMILDFLDGGLTVKGGFVKGAKYLIALGVSVTIYLVIVKITTRETGLFAYQNMDKMGSLSLSLIPHTVKVAYKDFLRFFFFNPYSGTHPVWMRYLFLAMVVITGILLLYMIVRRKIYQSPMKLLLIGVLLMLFPLAANLTPVMTQDAFIHQLMRFAFLLLFVMILALVERLARDGDLKQLGAKVPWTRIACWFLTLCTVFCIYHYAVLSNKAYMKQHLLYEQTYSYSVRLATNIENADGYSSEMPIVLVGKAQSAGLSIETLKEMGGWTGFVSDLVNIYNYPQFLQRYAGLNNPIEWRNLGKLEKLGIAEEVAAMPSYPEVGSIRKVGDRIIVKFSDASETVG